MNANEINFRCSQLSNLMTEPRNAESGKKTLSETCKAQLFETYVSAKYGRDPEVENKYIMKGLMVEEESLKLYDKMKTGRIKKNDFIIENKYIKGSPALFTGEDIIHADTVILLKSSWDIFSFFRAGSEKLNPKYYWQLQGYMALTGAQKGRIVHCLVNTPDALIEDEKRRLLWKMGIYNDANKTYQRGCNELEKNMRFDDIPVEERINEITVDRSDDNIERLYRRIVDCRRFMNEHLFKQNEVLQII